MNEFPVLARDPVVQRLIALIAEHHWEARFEEAVAQVRAHRLPQMRGIESTADFFSFLDDLVHWAPREQGDSLLVHDKLVEFHFLFDQPALVGLQSRGSDGADDKALSPLSAWIVDFARRWGEFLDTPASARHVASFRTDPAFRWDDYMPPPSGYLTFNQFFARHPKPGRRPVEALGDDGVVVAPADAVLAGQWRVRADSTITIDGARLAVKGLRWSLEQLLLDSPYAARFAGGLLTHVALRTFDYHRFHAPLAGSVLEARTIHGRAWLDVEVVSSMRDGVATPRLEAVEGTGYQFTQARGLIVLDTPCGLVACLPVGMAQVSSVVLTAEVGASLRKGEELGYFQFGGSDVVLVFEAACEVTLEREAGEHSMQGRRIGRCG